MSRSELRGFPRCTFTEIDQLPLHRSNQERSGKHSFETGTRRRNFLRLGKRIAGRSFSKSAMPIKAWKSSKICFRSISEIFSKVNWIRKLSRGDRRERCATGNRTLFVDWLSSTLSMHRFFRAEREPSEKCWML